eukprot:gene4872-5340_t
MSSLSIRFLFFLLAFSSFALIKSLRIASRPAVLPFSDVGFSPLHKCEPRVSILTEISDTPGALYDILKYFWKYEINLTHIDSRPAPKSNDGFHIYIDFDGAIGEDRTDRLIADLSKICHNTLVLDEKEVPWFPRNLGELDKIANRIKDAGSDLHADHPGFHDAVYRQRRQELADVAKQCSIRDPIPLIDYTKEEIQTWGVIYNKLADVHRRYACKEYLHIKELLEKECGFGPDQIPQARDLSDFLKARTGFTLRPVAGLLSSRDFLNGLAFRVFFSTQYIRHSSRPLYTPEPDIVHELVGHAPMFADQDFADFSQEIGLASLGASDEDVERLATCYWHSVEFGLLRDSSAPISADGSFTAVKAYGAGLLSSFGELEYSCANTLNTAKDVRKPKLLPWDPKVAGSTAYPITDYQPTYFVAESLADAKLKMRKFTENLPKPFYARYNPLTDAIWVDRAVRVDEPAIDN